MQPIKYSPRSCAVGYHRKPKVSWGLTKWVLLVPAPPRTRSFRSDRSSRNVEIDFKAAYDTVDREQLWQIMHDNGFPDKLTRLIKATLDRVMCHVRVSGDLAEPFESRRGLRQGDGLSCSLFNIGLEGVVRRAGIDTRCTIFNRSVQLLGFADDIDIIARDKETVKETYFGLRKTLTSSCVLRRTKLTLYRTLIRPVVLYGHETWTLLAEDKRAL